MTRARRAGLLLGAALLVAGFVSLGVWQIERRAWKHDLIARVDARIHAAPTAAPARADWPGVSGTQDEYRAVTVSGIWLDGHETRVRAVTDLGEGFWLIDPLRRDDGSIVLINRGFIPSPTQDATAHPAPLPAGAVTVSGLLRMTEPGGGFLHHNDPQAGRWYSRDVAAIAQADGLPDTAPYFIDATVQPGISWPRGGMTVVSFPDNHLQYALTWFGMALLTLVWIGYVMRRGDDQQRDQEHDGADGQGA